MKRGLLITVGTLDGLGAVMVGGQESTQWFGQPELAGYQLFAVTRGEESAWEI
jgi:hypothetical protein